MKKARRFKSVSFQSVRPSPCLVQTLTAQYRLCLTVRAGAAFQHYLDCCSDPFSDPILISRALSYCLISRYLACVRSRSHTMRIDHFFFLFLKQDDDSCVLHFTACCTICISFRGAAGKPVPGSPMQIGYSTEFIATFMVPYAKGTLEAKCTNLGANAPTTTLSTAGAPVALKVRVQSFIHICACACVLRLHMQVYISVMLTCTTIQFNSHVGHIAYHFKGHCRPSYDQR